MAEWYKDLLIAMVYGSAVVALAHFVWYFALLSFGVAHRVVIIEPNKLISTLEMLWCAGAMIGLMFLIQKWLRE